MGGDDEHGERHPQWLDVKSGVTVYQIQHRMLSSALAEKSRGTKLGNILLAKIAPLT